MKLNGLISVTDTKKELESILIESFNELAAKHLEDTKLKGFNSADEK